ncbi:hypothetical protein [Parasitella parasitica]|uniref:RNase H type-1 domain-containing protein n=1 Tax=Parasitella parasitica TaxID=35722 RepID=A0A0B7NXE9_9FUNG|nr:hypothetical protein [Parasitella parasitica]
MQAPRRPRIPDQQGKECVRTEDLSRISWFPLQHQVYDNVSTTFKDQEIAATSTTSPKCDQSLMQMGCESTEKDDCTIPAISEALLHIRHLQRDLARSLHLNHNNWNSTCEISQKSKEEIQWWKAFLVKKNGLLIQQIPLAAPETTIFVDASDVGWGVSSNHIETSGFWSQLDKEKFINIRELTAIYYALLMHAKKLNSTTIQVFSDNITALTYVINKSRRNRLVRSIGPSSKNSKSVQSKSTEDSLPTCTRHREYQSRQIEPSEKTDVRNDDSTKDVQTDSQE